LRSYSARIRGGVLKRRRRLTGGPSSGTIFRAVVILAIVRHRAKVIGRGSVGGTRRPSWPSSVQKFGAVIDQRYQPGPSLPRKPTHTSLGRTRGPGRVQGKRSRQSYGHGPSVPKPGPVDNGQEFCGQRGKMFMTGLQIGTVPIGDVGRQTGRIKGTFKTATFRRASRPHGPRRRKSGLPRRDSIRRLGQSDSINKWLAYLLAKSDKFKKQEGGGRETGT